MAQFLALIPMTASNFDSEAAADGQVLTADGAGGAAWEAGGGGGGVSFGWAIPVLSDWSTASNAWTDIKAETGMEDILSTAYTFYIELWEGAGDASDFGTLKVGYQSGEEEVEVTCSWEQYENPGFADPGFTTAPSSGTAYIVGMKKYVYIEPG